MKAKPCMWPEAKSSLPWRLIGIRWITYAMFSTKKVRTVSMSHAFPFEFIKKLTGAFPGKTSRVEKK
jgi:hypothetical protein